MRAPAVAKFVETLDVVEGEKESLFGEGCRGYEDSPPTTSSFLLQRMCMHQDDASRVSIHQASQKDPSDAHQGRMEGSSEIDLSFEWRFAKRRKGEESDDIHLGAGYASAIVLFTMHACAEHLTHPLCMYMLGVAGVERKES